MNIAEFQLQASAIRDWRPTRPAPCPRGCGRSDGTRILWANPAGADVFGAADGAALATEISDPADPHRRQVARLAAPAAVRTARSGWSGCRALARRPACSRPAAVSRLDFPDGSHGILVRRRAAAARCRCVERLQRLVEGQRQADRGVCARRHVVGASDARALRQQPVEPSPSNRRCRPRRSRVSRMVLRRVGTGRRRNACWSTPRHCGRHRPHAGAAKACCNSICRTSKPRRATTKRRPS